MYVPTTDWDALGARCTILARHAVLRAAARGMYVRTPRAYAARTRLQRAVGGLCRTHASAQRFTLCCAAATSCMATPDGSVTPHSVSAYAPAAFRVCRWTWLLRVQRKHADARAFARSYGVALRPRLQRPRTYARTLRATGIIHFSVPADLLSLRYAVVAHAAAPLCWRGIVTQHYGWDCASWLLRSHRCQPRRILVLKISLGGNARTPLQRASSALRRTSSWRVCSRARHLVVNITARVPDAS